MAAWGKDIGSGAARRRLHKEIKEICDGKWKEQLFAVGVPKSEDILYLRGILISPSEAPTGNYIFTLEIFVPSEYPFGAPRMVFANEVWHPKIRPTFGNICLPELSPENWEPQLRLNTLLPSIGEMLRHPGDLPHDSGRILNGEAAEQFWEDQEVYRKTALKWAEKDNSGYGMVQFEDLRLAAIQSCLLVPSLILYECHFFCRRCTSLDFELIAIVIPSLTIYRQKVEKDYKPIKRVTISPEFDFNEKEMAIHLSEFSRDKCWKVTLTDTIFKKAQVDKMDPRKDPPQQCLITLTWCRPELEPVAFTEKFRILDSNKSEIRSFDVHVDPTAYKTPATAAEASQKSCTKPTLPLLMSLPLSSGKKVNLTEVVGAQYFAFGVHLLNDEKGSLMEAMESELHKVPENIVRKTLIKWLEGRGKEITWNVLVEVLESIKKNELACDIKSLYI